MNPFLFKSHALLHSTLVLLTGAGQVDIGAVLILIGVYASTNLWTAWWFRRIAKRSAEIRIVFPKAYLLALPATLALLPLIVTLLNDVAGHQFLFDDRYIFLFALAVVLVMLAGFYGVVLHHRGGQPAGSEAGLTLALGLLLASLVAGSALLGLDAWLGFVPDIQREL